MLDEALAGLAIHPDGRYVDATFGRGGHSRAILQRLGGEGRLLAIDRDAVAIDSQAARSLCEDARFTLVHGRFSALTELVRARGWEASVDGILLDLGVSSPQLDEAERGFSFSADGPLDMRMDPSSGESAAQWLARVDEATLACVLFEYGEERHARRIARAIVAARSKVPLQRTAQLAELVMRASPTRDRHKHPATRTFQALRIAINQELDELRQVLPQAAALLRPGGRLAVIAFHSLEDRIVKRFIRDAARAQEPIVTAVSPRMPNSVPLKPIGKAQFPHDDEVRRNPRARSAVLRVAEKLADQTR